MAVALPYIATALAGVGVVKQIEAGNKADKLADANAKLEERQTAEEARRLKSEQAKVEATTKARAAAGGVEVGGSQSMFLQDMKAEHSKELAWLKTSGASRAAATRQGGSNARSQAFAGAASSAANTADMAYRAFGT